MTVEGSNARPHTLVTDRLPWFIGGIGLLLYLFTLNHWLSVYSLGTVARVSGWLWRPELDKPLTAALLFPFRFLPEASIPLALNLFTAVCAALTLTLLARSVALLPHDISTKDQSKKDWRRSSLGLESRSIGTSQGERGVFLTNLPNQPFSNTILSTPTAWVPPLLASLLCGLQLTFWEHATSASGEMVDLLLFAYIIRCLLEFRLDQNQSWLSRAACIYAAGMANNWALIGFLPVFIVAILRAKGYGPFRERSFLLRMLAWGSVGLSLYLLLPTALSLSPHSQVDFWAALKGHLKSQKEILGYFRRPAFRSLAIASLLPLLMLSIRWKSHSMQFGDDTRLGVFLTKALVHLVHGLVLLCSLWIALDPSFSPRHLGLGTPMLTYYYLSALAFGYCVGYFLLFGSHSAAEPNSEPARSARKLPFAPLLIGVSILLICAVPLVLISKNLPQIRSTNGPSLRQFANNLCLALPQGKSVVLSDDPAEFLFLRAALTTTHGREKAPLLLDGLSLTSAQYHRLLAQQFKSRWAVPPPSSQTQSVSSGRILELISAFVTNEPTVYLYPSFGILLELFETRPSGPIHLLYPRNLSISSSLPPKFISANEQQWQNSWSESLQALAVQTKEQRKFPPGFARALRQRLFLATERNATLSFAGAAWSRRINEWGVQMQRLGLAPQARTWFQRAIDLNPENLTAQINLKYAERCQNGDTSRLDLAAVQNEFSELFAKYKNWHGIAQANGPVDEPSFLFRSGRLLLSGGNRLQALADLSRSVELAPDWPAPKLWLAQCHIQLRNFAGVLEVADSIERTGLPKDPQGLAHLLECKATALRNLARTNEAAAYIESFVSQYSRQSEVLSVAADLYQWNKQFDKELGLLNELLAREPGRADFLSRKGAAELQLSRFDAAIGTLSAALTLAPKNENTRLCRAVAYLGADKLDAAGADYHELLATSSNPRNALFGLGTIAWRKQDTNQAIHYYRQYLSNGVTQARQDLLAAERLKQLTGHD